MNNTKVLLLDFDQTLTKHHTTGALCFSNSNFDKHLNPNNLFRDEQTFSENSSADASFLMETLEKFIEKGICIGIMTMADARHGVERRKQLSTELLRQSYHVVAGRDLVMRWFCCIALKACNFNEEQASERIMRLFKSQSFCIAARFVEGTKRLHFVELLRIFESRGVLNPYCIKPQEIVYGDDSAQLLVDMQEAVPGIHTILAVGGLTEIKWQNIIENF